MRLWSNSVQIGIWILMVVSVCQTRRPGHSLLRKKRAPPPDLVSDVVPTDPFRAVDDLRIHLLSGYDPLSRPISDHTKNISARFSFHPLHLTEIDEVRGLMIFEFWITLAWEDAHLKWEPKEFQGQKKTHFADSEIWKPDIAIYESRGNEIDPYRSVFLTVNSSGYVKWTAPGTSHTICELEYANYPRDKQTCFITFGSWTHHGNSIDLLLEEDQDFFSILQNANPHWDIVHIEGVRIPFPTPDNETTDPCIEFTIEMVRKGAAEEDMISLPRAMAIVLLLSIFFLPANSDRKFTLASVSAIIQTCLIVLTAIDVPSLAAVPAALRSLKASLTITIIAMIFEIAVLGLIGCNTCSPPMWLTSFLESPKIMYALCACGLPQAASTVQSDGTRVVESNDPRKKDWHLIATLLDKFAFIFFLFLYLVTGSFW